MATLVSSDNQPLGALASSQGNAQPIKDGFGGYVVGWGNLPYFSAFDGHGNLTFDASFPTGVTPTGRTCCHGTRTRPTDMVPADAANPTCLQTTSRADPSARLVAGLE